MMGPHHPDGTCIFLGGFATWWDQKLFTSPSLHLVLPGGGGGGGGEDVVSVIIEV